MKNLLHHKMLDSLKKDGICISNGNKKLFGIHSFSLPSITTCPGRSSLCESICYAARYEKQYKNTTKAYSRNLELLENDMDFVEKRLNEFLKSYGGNHRYFRIHVAGDFYSPEYAEMWYRIIRKNKTINFTAYTRSWRDNSIVSSLIKMNNLTNSRIFLSVDKETGFPSFNDFDIAYLSKDDVDVPLEPSTIVFRDKIKTAKSKLNDSTVCPYEMGFSHSKQKINCQSCLLCYKNKH